MVPASVNRRSVCALTAVLFLASHCGSSTAATDDGAESAVVGKPENLVPDIVDAIRLPSCVAFSPDGNLLAIGVDAVKDDEVSVVLVDRASNRVVGSLRGFRARIFSIEFLPSSDGLVATSWDGRAKLWSRTKSWDKAEELPWTLRQVRTSCVSPDGNYLVQGGRRGARIWSLRKHVDLIRPDHLGGEPESVAFSPDGKHFAVALDDRPAISVWRTSDFARVGLLAGHDKGKVQIAYSENGKTIITAGEDGTIRRWDATTYEETKRVDLESPVQNFSITADDKLIAVSTDNNGVQLLRQADLAHHATVTPPDRNWWAVHLAISHDGRTLACVTGPNDSVFLFRIAQGKAK